MNLPGLPPSRITRVDCGSCRKCCQNGQLIVLVRGLDDLTAFPLTHYTQINGQMMLVLDHKENGDCIYLGEAGCEIYGRHPTLCRAFDCVDFAEKLGSVLEATGLDSHKDSPLKEGLKRLCERRKSVTVQ